MPNPSSNIVALQNVLGAAAGPPPAADNTLLLVQPWTSLEDLSGNMPKVAGPNDPSIETGIVGPWGDNAVIQLGDGTFARDLRYGPIPIGALADDSRASIEDGFCFEWWGRYSGVSVPNTPFTLWNGYTDIETDAIPNYFPATPFHVLASWRAANNYYSRRILSAAGAQLAIQAGQPQTVDAWIHYAMVYSGHPSVADQGYTAYFQNGVRNGTSYLASSPETLFGDLNTSPRPYFTFGSAVACSYQLGEIRISKVPRYDASQPTITVPSGPFTLD